MWYEINVSLHGSHFFATSSHSIVNYDRLVTTVRIFREKFPESEGYEVTAREWKKTGKPVNT